MDFLKKNPAWIILGSCATMITMLVVVATYLDSSFASADEVTAIKDAYATHVASQEKINENQIKNLKVITNKLRHEIKAGRIDELTFEKKMLLIKGDQMTDHDKKVMVLLSLEIDTLNGR